MSNSPFEKLGLLPSFVSILSDLQLITLLERMRRNYKLLYLPDKAGSDTQLAKKLGEKQSEVNEALDSLSKSRISAHKKVYLQSGPTQQRIRLVELEYSDLVTRLEAIMIAIKTTKVSINELENTINHPDYDYWVTALFSCSLGEIYQTNALYLRHATNMTISVLDESEEKKAVLDELQEFIDLDERLEPKETARLAILESLTAKKPQKGKKDPVSKERTELTKLKEDRKTRKEYIEILKKAALKTYYVSQHRTLMHDGKSKGIRILGSAMNPTISKLTDVMPLIYTESYLVGIDDKGKFVVLGQIMDFDKLSNLDEAIEDTVAANTARAMLSTSPARDALMPKSAQSKETKTLSVGFNSKLYDKNPFEALGFMPEFLRSIEKREDIYALTFGAIKIMKELFHSDNTNTANEAVFKDVISAEAILSNPAHFETSLAEYLNSATGDSKIQAIQNEMKLIQRRIEENASNLAELKVAEVRAQRKNADLNSRHDSFFQLLFDGIYRPNAITSGSLGLFQSSDHSIILSSKTFGSRKYTLSVEGFDVFATSDSSRMRLIGSTIPNIFSNETAAIAALSKFKDFSFTGVMPYIQPQITKGSFLVAVDEPKDAPLVVGKIEKIEIPNTLRKRMRTSSRTIRATMRRLSAN